MVGCFPGKKTLKSLLVLWVILASYSCVALLELERNNPNDPNAKNYQPTGATTDNNSSSDTSPPNAPTSLSATVLSDTEIRLTWQAANDNETAANEIVYEACYSESFNGCDSFNSLKSVTGGVLTLDLTSLQSNTNYFIKLRAKDAAGNTSSAVSATGQTQVTGSVGGVVFSVAGGQYNSDQTLSLSSSTTGATICYATGASPPADPTCSNGICAGSTYDTALEINTDQTVKAMACKASLINSGVNSETYTIDKQAPTAPSNFTGTPAATSVNLTWDAASDNSGSVSYEICQSTTSNGCDTFSTNYTSTGTSRTVSGLNSATTYYFSLRATDAVNNKSSSITFSTTTTLPKKYIFITADTYQGDMNYGFGDSGGRDGADFICAQEKSAAGYSGIPFRAFIAVHNRKYDCSAGDCDWSLQANTEYFIVISGSETKVFTTDSDAKIDTGALSGFTGDKTFWTGMRLSMSAGDNCDHFIRNSSSYLGKTGFSTSTDTDFYSIGNDNCDQARHILCIEQ